MSSREFSVNGTDYRIMLTDQVAEHVNALRNLYGAAYEDPESFEDLSAEISETIHEIASGVEPPVDDSDLDGMIQEVIKAVDSKAEARENELNEKQAPTSGSRRKGRNSARRR
ncbi:MAG: hypothetical protein J4F28_08240 [Nitrosopumilaceae archaeon]|nr:hypothetical protein [Nitrosopumilaceae archaeon]